MLFNICIYFDIQEYASICYLMRVYTRIYANIRVYTNFQTISKSIRRGIRGATRAGHDVAGPGLYLVLAAAACQ